ncbi:MAG: hypothetical protein KDD82_31455, partial [Planctomycetes bacterium]|nr:hypothetical protein [Planctomycetota bacterium]
DWGRELPWTELVQPVCARAAAVAVALALPRWRAPEVRAAHAIDDDDLATVEAILRLTQAWIERPTQALVDQVVGQCASRALGGLSGDVGLELASVVCQPVASNARSPYSLQQHTARSAAQVVDLASDAVYELGHSEGALRDAIRAATIPWLLDAPALP